MHCFEQGGLRNPLGQDRLVRLGDWKAFQSGHEWVWSGQWPRGWDEETGPAEV